MKPPNVQVKQSEAAKRPRDTKLIAKRAPLEQQKVTQLKVGASNRQSAVIDTSS